MSDEDIKRRIEGMGDLERENYLDILAGRYERSPRVRKSLIQVASHMLNDISLYQEAMKDDMINGDYRMLCQDAEFFLAHLGEKKTARKLEDVDEEMRAGLNALWTMSGQLRGRRINKKTVDKAYGVFKENLWKILEELSGYVWDNNRSL